MRKALRGAGGVIALGVSVLGCVYPADGEDASRFRDAVPRKEAVAVPGPEQTAATTAQSLSPARHALGVSDGGTGTSWAKYYGFTREVRDGVNDVTGAILGAVWLAAQTHPSSLVPHEAVWGPWTDSLEPATWRLRITEVGDGEFEYRLEGRPKASTSNADFRAVVTGKGWGRGQARRPTRASSTDAPRRRPWRPPCRSPARDP